MNDLLWVGLGALGLALFLGFLNARDRRGDIVGPEPVD
jgi:hypothetical protein